MENLIFEPAAITLPDTGSMPCEYTTNASGAILCRVSMQDGRTATVTITQGNPMHSAAAAAMQARAALDAQDADLLAVITGHANEHPQDTPPQKPATERPLPDWAGQTLHGNGYKFRFDEYERRTLLIFEDVPCKAARDACKEGGFYWSPTRTCWVRGLNEKSRRKAEKLAQVLNTLQLYPQRRSAR